MNKSFIISYREVDEERKNNLKMVLDYLYWMMDNQSEILLIEQDSDSKVIKWLKESKSYNNIKHIFVRNEGIFNKGWGYNIGAKNAKSENLIFHDADMFLKLESYKHSINLLNQFDVVNPYKSIIFLSEETTSIFKQNNYNFSVTRLHKPSLTYVISGGIFMMKKNKFLEIKGFDEECYGYGHEDDILDVKIQKLGLKLQTINDTSVHIYHNNSKNNKDEYYSFVELNKLLFSRYDKMSKDELKIKINEIEFFGENDKSINNEVSFRHVKRDMVKKASERILDNILDLIDDDFIEEIINDLSSRIYNQIMEIISEKLKDKISNIKYTKEDKKNLVSKIISKMKI